MTTYQTIHLIMYVEYQNIPIYRACLQISKIWLEGDMQIMKSWSMHARTHAHSHARTQAPIHTSTHARTQARTYARTHARMHAIPRSPEKWWCRKMGGLQRDPPREDKLLYPAHGSKRWWQEEQQRFADCAVTKLWNWAPTEMRRRMRQDGNQCGVWAFNMLM